MAFENIRNDFEVHYRIRTTEEGGRRTGSPYQGYRCDWLYAEDWSAEAGNNLREYMIWPTFVDEMGVPIVGGIPVPIEGTAMMTIVNEQIRDLHRHRIKVGTRGFFMEGAMRTAEATVTRIVQLIED